MKAEAEELKKKGNDCMKAGNHTEAVFHYTHAIKIEPKNAILYSNRSAAFLKIEQFYLALQDANKSIQLDPNWTKGYFRKGEVEFRVKNYSDALKSYNHAYVLDCNDEGISSAISKTTKEINRVKKANKQEPILYSCIGGGVGFLITLADQYLTDKPSIPHWAFQVILILVLAAIGYSIHRVYRYMLDMQQNALIEPPADILSELSGDSRTEEEDNSSEIPKRQSNGPKGGRQRYKKGKS